MVNRSRIAAMYIYIVKTFLFDHDVILHNSALKNIYASY